MTTKYNPFDFYAPDLNSFLIQNLVPEHQGIVTIVAGRGMGKTTLALDLSMAIAHGKPFLGHACKKAKVKYLHAGHDWSLEVRTEALIKHRNYPPLSRHGDFRITPNYNEKVLGPVDEDPATFAESELVAAVETIFGEEEVNVVVVDTVACLLRRNGFASAEDICRFLMRLRNIDSMPYELHGKVFVLFVDAAHITSQRDQDAIEGASDVFAWLTGDALIGRSSIGSQFHASVNLTMVPVGDGTSGGVVPMVENRRFPLPLFTPATAAIDMTDQEIADLYYADPANTAIGLEFARRISAETAVPRQLTGMD